MKPFRSLVVFLLGFCLATGCETKPRVRQPSAPLHEYHTMLIGLCEDYPKDSRSLAAARNDLQLLKTNGIQVLRISLSWLDMEPEPGQFDWSFWDDFIRMAVDEYGVRLIPYVCYTPSWASISTNNDFWQQPPADNARFANFITQLVSRYKNRIHSWEIWNEPDNPSYWRGSVDQFEKLLQAGAQAVRSADPGAKVVMGGLAWNPDFLQAVLDSAAISNVDIINLHNYYETWASEPLERIPFYVGRAAELIHEYGQRQPIWIAEVGYSDYRRGAFVSDQYHAYFQDEHTPQAQAASLVRVMTLAMASGNVSLLAWYRIHDLPSTERVIGDDNNRHLGILDQQNAAKPALKALQFLRSMFSDRFECIDNKVRVEKSINAPVEVHAFANSDGSIVIIAWMRSYVPGERSKNSSGNVPDRRSTAIDLEFPFALENSGVLFNELGERYGAIHLSLHGENSRISNLPLRDGDVTVLHLRRPH